MMRALRIASPQSAAATACVVLLPGAYHAPEDFLSAGFDRAIRERGLGIELILVDPGLRHIADRDWLGELPDRVLHPVRAGRCPLWLGGISLGGFMALRCAADHPRLADGLCLIAPYLGDRIMAAEVAAQGGLAGWRPGACAEEDDQRVVWRYLQGVAAAPPALYLGLGSEDRLGATQGLLARALPSAVIHTLPGGHDWPVWRLLWDNFLDRYAAGSA
jgi:pimeloyl-ACP methyl ester carboxylesterase